MADEFPEQKLRLISKFWLDRASAVSIPSVRLVDLVRNVVADFLAATLACPIKTPYVAC